jgi:hypothetical protein
MIRVLGVVTAAVLLASGAPAHAEERASHTFGRDTTQKIYDTAVTGGVAAVSALCTSVAPGWLKLGCPKFASVVVDYVVSPPTGRCLQVDARIARPPLAVRYVDC